MTRLQEVVERQVAIRAELLEIEELTEPTDEDVARQDTLLGEYDGLEAERAPLAERAERVEAVRNAATNPTNVEAGTRFTTNVVVKQDPFENLEALRFSYDDRNAPPMTEDVIGRAVTAITDHRPRGISDDEVQNAVRMVETVPGVAQHALIHGSPAYRSAFQEYLRSKGQPLYSAEEMQAVRTALSLTGANGGYVLPTLLDPTLIHTGTASKNPMRRISRVVSGTQNVWHGVSVGNVTSYWKAEAAVMTEGNPTLSNPSVTAAMLTAYLTGSYEIFEDSNLQAQMPGLIAESFEYKESDAFVVGSGSTAPKGVVTAISATAASTVTATTRGAFTTASAADVFAVLNAVPSRYEDSSTWLANKQTFNTIKQMSTGSQGSYFWSDFNAAIGNPLLGSPIAQSSAMATAQTSGTVLAILGDFSQFVIYDRIGTSVEYIQNVIDQATGLPTGQRALVAHKRVGSDCTDINAFRFLKT